MTKKINLMLENKENKKIKVIRVFDKKNRLNLRHTVTKKQDSIHIEAIKVNTKRTSSIIVNYTIEDVPKEQDFYLVFCPSCGNFQKEWLTLNPLIGVSLNKATQGPPLFVCSCGVVFIAQSVLEQINRQRKTSIVLPSNIVR